MDSSKYARLKNLAARSLCLVGVPTLFRWLHRRRLAILMYHGVTERPLEPPCWTQLAREQFERQMKWIASRYNVLPLEEALNRWAEGTLPPYSCAITFDDGYRNNATVAGPVLQSLGLPATIFLVTGAVGTGQCTWPDRIRLALLQSKRTEAGSLSPLLNSHDLCSPTARGLAATRIAEALKRRPRAEKDRAVRELVAALGEPGAAPEFEMLTWEEVDRLIAAGTFSFAGQAVQHEILSQCEDEVVLQELHGCQSEVARRTRRTPSVYAWPNGRLEDFDGRAIHAARAVGVRYGLTTREGLVPRRADPYRLPRVAVGADLTFDRFRLLVTGVLPWRRRLGAWAR